MVVTNDCRKQSLVVALKVEWLNSYQSLMCIYKYSYLIFFFNSIKNFQYFTITVNFNL